MTNQQRCDRIEHADESTFVVKAGTYGALTVKEDVTVSYPLYRDHFDGSTGIRTRITSWRDRDEVRTTFPDGRETLEVVRPRPVTA